ncbi:MAG: metallophosphoesterase, partial [Anaerolineae bacterium]
MRLALLADIHGNGSALRAVLADLDRQGGADCLLVLGDIV